MKTESQESSDGRPKDKTKRKKLVLVTVGILLVTVGVLSYAFLGKKTEMPKEEPQNVIVSKAWFGPVVRYINTIGTLTPCDSVELKSEVNAKIEKIYFNEGAIVKKGDLLVQFDESLAQAKLMSAEAHYRKAKVEYELLDKLADKGAAARIKREQSRADLEMSSANLNSAKVELEKHKIFAPFGGMIGIKNISVGQYIQAGMDLVKLVDNYPLKVDFTVAEVDIDKIYVSQEIQIFVGGDDLQEYSAVITAIEPESDKISHSFKVRANLDVPEEVAVNSQILKPGRFVKVRISVNEGQQGILIPESALEKSGKEDMVYIVSDGRAMRRLVIPGIRKDGNVEIITGLNEGDVVITMGQQGVSDGRAVTAREGTELINVYKKYYDQRKVAANRKK